MISFRTCSVGVVALVLLAVLLTGCSSTGNDESPSIIGTWVNASYDGGAWPGKFVIGSDYSSAMYNPHTASDPFDTGTVTVVEQSGNTYRWRYDRSGGGFTVYFVGEVTESTMVGQVSESGFPPQSDDEDISYTRQ